MSCRSPQFLGGAGAKRVQWLELEGRWASVGKARATAGGWLRTLGLPDESCKDAVLVLSELATNAIRHTASARILCCVGLTADWLIHLEVHDHDTSSHRPLPCNPSPDDEGGRGLLLVECIAKRWGVERSAFTRGNAVWAKLTGARDADRAH